MSNKHKHKNSSKKSPTKETLDPNILYNFIDQQTEAQDELIQTTKTLITCSKESFQRNHQRTSGIVYQFLCNILFTNSNLFI